MRAVGGTSSALVAAATPALFEPVHERRLGRLGLRALRAAAALADPAGSRRTASRRRGRGRCGRRGTAADAQVSGSGDPTPAGDGPDRRTEHDEEAENAD